MAEQRQHPDPNMQHPESEDLGPTAPIQADPVPESVAATLVKSSTSNQELIDTIKSSLPVQSTSVDQNVQEIRQMEVCAHGQ